MSETKIIAFEGIDGTGKSVQMEELRARLEQRGFSVGVTQRESVTASDTRLQGPGGPDFRTHRGSSYLDSDTCCPLQLSLRQAWSGTA